MPLPEFRMTLDVGDGIQRQLRLQICASGVSFYTPERPSESEEGRLASEGLAALDRLLEQFGVPRRTLRISDLGVPIEQRPIDRIAFDKPLNLPSQRGW